MARGILLALVLLEGAANGAPQVGYDVVLLSPVPDAELAGALVVAERHFALAGIRLRRHDPRHSSGDCGPRLKIFLVGERTFRGTNPSVDDLAYTAVSVPGAPPVVIVSYGRIAAVSSRRQLAPAVLLGHVISHELGHLIAGRGFHRGVDLMKPQWTTDQLVRLAQGRLSFSSSEAGVLRQRILATTAGCAGGRPLRSGVE